MTAVPIPNAKVQFIDLNGAPLVGGSVAYYTPGTLVPKMTWQDPGQTTPNPAVITLDGFGQAIVWGSGNYRQIVMDAAGDVISDGLTQGLSALGSFAAIDFTNVDFSTLPDAVLDSLAVALVESGAAGQAGILLA